MSKNFLFIVFVFVLSTLPTLGLRAGTSPPRRDQMAPAEAETLFKIMDSMSSDEDWRSAHPNPCSAASPSWPGIECKPGPGGFLHVSRLDFGTPPNPSCKPAATFPYLVFSLPYIQSAFFFNCFTRMKTSLSVSSLRLVNSSLQQLSLRSNPALVGPIPPQISSLRSLEVLTLSQNGLSGAIPQQLFTLASLIHLDLSYNRLSGFIPYQVGNLKNLVGLDLSYNSLYGSIPTAIGQLGKLQKLDLSSNALVGIVPSTVDRLGSLVFVALSNNRLTGTFPIGIVKLQSLQYFIMENNPMRAPLPPAFGLLVKLQELRLANCGFTGAIPASYTQLSNLTTLSLQNNQLTGPIPPGFGALSHIYHLNLSRNQLTGVVPFDVTFLRRLGRNLDLTGNTGLCLSPGDARGINAGVSACRTGRNGSLILPLRSSGADHKLHGSISLFSPLFLLSSLIMLFGFCLV